MLEFWLFVSVMANISLVVLLVWSYCMLCNLHDEIEKGNEIYWKNK